MCFAARKVLSFCVYNPGCYWKYTHKMKEPCARQGIQCKAHPCDTKNMS